MQVYEMAPQPEVPQYAPDPPKSKKPSASEMSRLLLDAIPKTLAARQKREQRWQRVRDMSYGDFQQMPDGGQGPGVTGLNIEQIKMDAYTSGVAGSMCSQRPMVLVEPYDGSDCPAITAALNRMYEAADIEREYPEVLENAWWSNLGVWFVSWQKQPVCKPILDVVDPSEMIAWPAYKKSLMECRVLLRMLVRSRQEIEDLMEDGTYDRVSIGGTSGLPNYNIPSIPSQAAVSDTEDDIVTLYHGYVKMSAKPHEPWWEVTCSSDGGTIYKIEPRMNSLAPVVPFRMRPRRSTDGVYPSVSKGNDLQSVQLALSAAAAAHEEAAAIAANPPVLTDDAKLAKAIGGRLRPGQAVVGDSLEHTIPILNRFDPDGSVQYQQWLVQGGNLTSGQGNAQSGTPDPGVNTATEQRDIQAGADAQMDSAISCASEGFEYLAAVLYEEMYLDQDKEWFHQYFKDPELAQAFLDESGRPLCFRSAVTSASGTPRAQSMQIVQTAQVFAELGVPMNPMALGELLLGALELSGVSDARRLMADPSQMVQMAVQTIAQATGVPPETIVQGIQLLAQANASGQLPNQSAGGGVPVQPGGGMGQGGGGGYA